MCTDSIISISNISKSFEDVEALIDVSFSVKRGIFGLIGPNGAGKTTLLRILLGLIKPDEGTAHVLGFDISKNLLDVKERIGVLHEKPSYPSTLTPHRYLNYIRGFYQSTENISHILKEVGLYDAEDRLIGKLSAGMLQRLGIAQALIGCPDLVFLDEPTANLDVVGREEVIKLIVELHNDSGVSFFVTSHILSELETLCHDIAIINKGRLVSGGPLPETVDKLTLGVYKVITSDAQQLFASLRSTKRYESAEITGANSIRMRIAPEEIESAEKGIQEIARRNGIKVYSFERADSLTDAFREAISNE